MINAKKLDQMEKAGIVTLDHSAYARGYVSRKKPPAVERYIGRLGNGYRIHIPSYNTTSYHIVEYYFLDEESQKIWIEEGEDSLNTHIDIELSLYEDPNV